MTWIDRPGKAILLILLLGFFSFPGTAQRTDFRSWFEIELNTRLKNGWEVSGELEQRLKESNTQVDRLLYTLSVEYDFTDYLSATGGVRFLLATQSNLRLQPGYRLNGDLSAQKDLGRTRFSFRMRFQYGFSDLPVLEIQESNRVYLRNRVKVAHSFYGTRFTLFGSAESWGRLFSPEDRYLAGMRYVAGAEYALTFRTGINLRYLADSERNREDPLLAHVVALGFSHTF